VFTQVMVGGRGLRVGVTSVIGVAIAALTLVPGTASATYPGANGLIAFQGARGHHLSDRVWINTIRPDGTDLQPLAPGYGPSWSPDGMHIVLGNRVGPHENPQIFTIGPDGSDLRRVTHSRLYEVAAGYSPNGRRILIGRSTPSPDQFVIATIRPDGSYEQILARDHQVWPFEYSPTGGRVLYSDDCQIWDMRPNGSHRRQLTNSANSCNNVQADYSPDGKHISFWHEDRPYVMRSDGSHAHPLGCSPGAGLAVYSPDGRRLACDQHIGPPRSAVGDIFTGTLRCADPFRVTYQADLGGAGGPSWQPLP
jgi:hypothetical protein